MMPKVYYLIGIGCAGKTYYAGQLAKMHEAVVVTPDEKEREIGARIGQITTQAKKILKSGTNCVIDSGFECLSPENRRLIIQGIGSLAEKVVGILLDTDISHCAMRLKKRSMLAETKVLTCMQKCLQENMPARDEGFEEIVVYSGVQVTVDGRDFFVYPDSSNAPISYLAAAMLSPESVKLNFASSTPEDEVNWREAQLFLEEVQKRIKAQGRVVWLETWSDGREIAKVERKKFTDFRELLREIARSPRGCKVFGEEDGLMVLAKTYADEREDRLADFLAAQQ